MTIDLTPEQERIVKDQLQSGRFRSIEEVISEALLVLRERERSSAAGANGDFSHAVREMLSFVQKNHVRLEGLSVKQLIREGHRL